MGPLILILLSSSSYPHAHPHPHAHARPHAHPPPPPHHHHRCFSSTLLRSVWARQSLFSTLEHALLEGRPCCLGGAFNRVLGMEDCSGGQNPDMLHVIHSKPCSQ